MQVRTLLQRGACALLFLAGPVFAQNSNMPLNIEVGMEPIGTVTVSNGTDIPPNTTFKYITILTLADTNAVAKIHVKLDTLDGGSHLTEQIFVFDQSVNNSNGISYFRSGNMVYLGLGIFTDFPVIYCEARVENQQGILSEAKKYNTLQ